MNEYTAKELSHLSDEDIKSLFFEVRSKLLSRKSFENNALRDLEIYYCYISREIENRNL